MGKRTECPNCQGTDYTWHIGTKVKSPVPDGMLRSHDVNVVAYLSCEDCSETIKVEEDTERIDQMLSGSPALLAAAKAFEDAVFEGRPDIEYDDPTQTTAMAYRGIIDALRRFAGISEPDWTVARKRPRVERGKTATALTLNVTAEHRFAWGHDEGAAASCSCGVEFDGIPAYARHIAQETEIATIKEAFDPTVMNVADLRDFRKDFFVKVDHITDQQIINAFNADASGIIHRARQWGWDDSDVRDRSADVLEAAGYVVEPDE